MEIEENNISQNQIQENEKNEKSIPSNNELSLESFNVEKEEEKQNFKVENKEENKNETKEEKKYDYVEDSKEEIKEEENSTKKPNLNKLESFSPIKTDENNNTINSEREKIYEYLSPTNFSISNDAKSKKNSFSISNKKKESSIKNEKKPSTLNIIVDNLEDKFNEKIDVSPIILNTSRDMKKSLNDTLSQIKNEIKVENKLIDEIDLKLSEISLNKIKRNKNKIFHKISNQKTNKTLNKLTLQSNHLQANINELNKAQLKLENESYMFIPSDSNVILHKEKLKKIKREKGILISKLNDINTQINTIVESETRNKSKAALIKNFLDNFETDKEKFSKAMTTISKEVAKNRKEFIEKKLKKDAENEKKYKDELLIKEHEKEMKKKEFIKSQKELEDKIKEKNMKIMDKSKPFINGAPSEKDKNYITADEKEIIRKEKEEALISLELAKRKQYYKPINIKELDAFSKQVIESERRTMAELEKKKIQLNELYKERKELLPKYHSKFYEYNLQNEKEFLNKEENRICEINKQKQQRKQFDKEVKKYFFPKKIDEKLKREREEIISNLNGENRYEKIRRLKSDIQKSSQKYKVPKLRLKKKGILNENMDYHKSNNNIMSRNRVITIPKIEENMQKNYLTEIREKRELRNQKLSQSVDNSTQWEKMLLNSKNNRNLFDNIYDVRVQADKMHKEATFKSKLLNIDDTSRKFPGIRNEIANLFVGSIQAKIEILKSLKNRTLENEEKN